MSAHRELQNAQRTLNEAVAHLSADCARQREGALSDIWPRAMGVNSSILRPIHEAYLALRQVQDRLDAPGGAAPRHTSIAAAHTGLPRKQTLRHTILATIIGHHSMYRTGMNISEVKGRLRKEHSSVSSAISELVKREFLKDSGTTRQTQHECAAIVWEPTDKALELFRAEAMGG